MSNFNFCEDYEVVSVLSNIKKFPDNIDIIKAREVWDKTEQGKDNVVAIMDTGVDINHPNLSNNIIGGYNITDDDGGNTNIYKDYSGHGTHVAGVISSYKNSDGRGIIGVAPRSKILVIKVIGKNGKGSYENLIKGIHYAENWVGKDGEKVNVINLSLGGSNPNEDLHKVIRSARQKGIIFVSSAGNHGDGNFTTFERSYPSYYKEVIQVGSITRDLKPSDFSNTNVNIDFVAPGEDVYSTHLNGEFVKLTGTSMAAPYVSGAILLILNMIDRTDETMIPYLVYQYLLTHAKKLNYSIYQVGNGLVQLIS